MNRRTALGLVSATAASLIARIASAAPARGRSADAGAGVPDLKDVKPGERVISIGYSPGAYSVNTSDGRSQVFLEANLRFKVDSSRRGPRPGAPVMLSSGTEGDRMLVLFASPEDLGGFISRSHCLVEKSAVASRLREPPCCGR